MSLVPKHYLDGLDRDLRQSLLEQLRILWTHTSTAIEGNSLTLGETHQVLTEGLTIQGKPISDHNEVIGHARAIDLIGRLVLGSKPLRTDDLFDLHKAVQTEMVTDVHSPVGSWKSEPNSTVVVLDEKQRTNDTYAYPRDVPALMGRWLSLLNAELAKKSLRKPVESYAALHAAFVRIHPFADGNGRMARLLANAPLLKAGHPPIVIQKAKRTDYIRALARWQLSLGRPKAAGSLVRRNKEYAKFLALCREGWEAAWKLVESHRRLQKKRGRKR